MIKEYLEISRLFNMGLTGVAPVLGALAMWGVGESSLPSLFILFCIGCLSHSYGFVLNDIMDIKLDKLSKELVARPLVSGLINRRRALWFAIACMVVSFILSFYFFQELITFLPVISILILAYVLATVYDVGSKKYPGMDFFVSSAVFFLIIFGAATVSYDRLFTTPLAWIVAFIGGIQVLFMNMINGAIKDIDHDAKGMANTLAIKLGATTKGGMVSLPFSFKALGYLIELARSGLIFLPFIVYRHPYNYIQIGFLLIFTLCTFFIIFRLFSIKTFDRNKIRKHIGLIVICMYATTPIMLSSLNPYIVLAAVIPPLWFILSNLVLHHTVFEPKTM